MTARAALLALLLWYGPAWLHGAARDLAAFGFRAADPAVSCRSMPYCAMTRARRCVSAR